MTQTNTNAVEKEAEGVGHTVLPWHTNGTRIYCLSKAGWRSREAFRVADAHSSSAGLANCAKHGEARANAAFIVRAVNCHEELLAALKEARAELKHYSSDHLNVIARIDALLQKAQGQQP